MGKISFLGNRANPALHMNTQRKEWVDRAHVKKLYEFVNGKTN